MSQTEKMLPRNDDAERCVLGGLLIDPYSYDQIAGLLQVEDFYLNAHRLIYEAFLALQHRKVTPDIISVIDELARTEKLDESGGPVAVTELINQVPTASNIVMYADIVMRTALFRRMIHAASEMAALAYHQEPGALEAVEKLVYDLRSASSGTPTFSSMKKVMDEYMDELGYLNSHRGELMGVSSGYEDIDRMLGGFQPSELILLAARPSVGKTALALCLAYNAALRGKKIAVFSLEMGQKLLARRFMAMASKVDMQRLRGGWIEDDEWERIMQAYRRLSDLPIWINDTAGNPVSSMRSMLRRLCTEHGQIDMVIVDYIGLIEPDTDAEKRTNLVQQIDAISRGLKSIAKEFDVPVIALAQLSRGVESRQNKRPMLADLRDSGSLEQNADVVMFLYRDDYYNQRDHSAEGQFMPTNIAELIIAKYRNGPIGNVSLMFEANHNMFYNISYGEEQ